MLSSSSCHILGGVGSHPKDSAWRNNPQKVCSERTAAAKCQHHPIGCPFISPYIAECVGQHSLHAGAQHRRLEGQLAEAGAISSRVKPPTGIDGLDNVSALRETNLFPVHLEKSAQVTPSLQDKARAQAQAQHQNDLDLSVQRLLPPFASQYDSVRCSTAGEGARVPARRSVRRRADTAELAENMRRARISGSQAQNEEDDVQVVQHTGCVPSDSLNLCACGA